MVGMVLVAVVTERDPEQEERERREFMLAIGYSEDGELEDLPKEVSCSTYMYFFLLACALYCISYPCQQM